MLPDRLRLASYNIRKSVGLDGRRDPGRVLDVVNALEADVVALQEVDKRLGKRPTSISQAFVEANSDLRVVELARTPVSLGWHGNAMLVHKDLPVRAVSHIDLPGLEPRGAVSVEIGDANRHLAVVGAHLGLVRRYRRAQLEQIRAHLAQTDPQAAAILGDFNEWAETRGLEPLAPDFRIVSPGKSFHSARPVAALDRVALGAGLSLQDAGVLETRLSRIASDHLPIWADIRWGAD